jgi:hypothetical protein
VFAGSVHITSAIQQYYCTAAVLVQQYCTLQCIHCKEEAHKQTAAFSLEMSLPLETLRELGKLSDFRKRGVILEQHFEVIKKHVRGGNCLANGDWEAIDLAWKLKGEGVFSEQEWATEIDGQLHAIINARPSLSTQPAAATPSAPSSAPAPLPREKTARPATAAAVNRGKGRMGNAAKGTGNIINAFAKGSGKPVSHGRYTAVQYWAHVQESG